MSSLLESINTTREETISTHYNAAVAELQEKVKSEPLKTTFHIYSGCISEKVTNEIAHRFTTGGLKASVTKSGMIGTNWSLTVIVDLPETLIHGEKKEEVDEHKEEEKTTSNLDIKETL